MTSDDIAAAALGVSALALAASAAAVVYARRATLAGEAQAAAAAAQLRLSKQQDHAQQVASRKAQLRAAFERDGDHAALVLYNDGKAAAEAVAIRARTPGEDPEGWARAVFYQVQPVTRLEPRARVAQRVIEADRSPLHFHVTLEWTNADRTRGAWASEITIPRAPLRPR